MSNATPRKKRVLVLTSTFPRWAGDKEPPFVFELCRRLSDGYEIHVLTPHAPGAARVERIDGVKVRRFRYCFTAWETLAYEGGILARLKQNRWRYALVPCFFIGQVIALVRLLRRERFDLIHAHWLIPQGLAAVLAGRLAKSPPLLCTSHGGDLFALKSRLAKRIKRWVMGRSAALTVVSQAMRDAVIAEGVAAHKLHVIPMGVDLTTRFIPSRQPREAKSLLFVGRLVEKKGVRYLIEALPQVLLHHPGTHLCIAGSGPEEVHLKQFVSRLGLHARVKFLGNVDNAHLPALYQRCEILVFPSIVAGSGDQEGFGLVPVEAMGCECVVIATDLPAMRDFIIDGETGAVVRQRDSQMLAEKITHLLDHPEIARSIGVRGRQFVLQRYDWSSIARHYAILIEQTMSST